MRISTHNELSLFNSEYRMNDKPHVWAQNLCLEAIKHFIDLTIPFAEKQIFWT